MHLPTEQLTSDPVLEIVTAALAATTAAMAVATFVVARVTSKAARAAADEAKATKELVTEARDDRDLRVRPVLTSADVPGDPASGALPGVAVRNIGLGPALNVVIWARHGANVYAVHGINLPAGELFPAPDVSTVPPKPRSVVLTLVDGANPASDPGAEVVGSSPEGDFVAYCVDQLERRLRFNLRRSDQPPDVWRKVEPAPMWAGAWTAAGAREPYQT